jgi:putative hydrolase of HD superfamily
MSLDCPSCFRMANKPNEHCGFHPVPPHPLAPDVVTVGTMALAFGRVDRITYHPDGQRLESDTDHTVMLGLVACAFAQRYLPELDLGWIAQYALVHDLPEVYAGDTPTLRIDADGRAAKKAREEAAMWRIHRETTGLPWVSDVLECYEQQSESDPEARYVRAMDKLLPKITHLLNGCVTIREHQRMSRSELIARYEEQYAELMAYAAEFPPLFALRAELVEAVLASLSAGQDVA